MNGVLMPDAQSFKEFYLMKICRAAFGCNDASELKNHFI